MRVRQVIYFLSLVFIFSMPFAYTGEAASAAGPTYNEKAVAEFYRGKTIRIVVGFSAGGG